MNGTSNSPQAIISTVVNNTYKQTITKDNYPSTGNTNNGKYRNGMKYSHPLYPHVMVPEYTEPSAFPTDATVIRIDLSLASNESSIGLPAEPTKWGKFTV